MHIFLCIYLKIEKIKNKSIKLVSRYHYPLQALSSAIIIYNYN